MSPVAAERSAYTSATAAPPLAECVAMPDQPDNRRDFAGLYRRTISPLRRYLSRLLGNPAEAEDIAHDAYLRVRPSVENASAHNPGALLYTTARRLAINRLKRRATSPVVSAEIDADRAAASAPGVVQQVIARQELARLEAAIARLPEGCRTVLLLRKIEQLSHQEISARLGIAISTIEKQHARALRLLRADLESTSTASTSFSREAQP